VSSLIDDDAPDMGIVRRTRLALANGSVLRHRCAYGLTVALVVTLGTPAGAVVRIDHRPPACARAGRSLQVRVCTKPHVSARRVHLRYRQAPERPWREVALTSDMPCLVGRLPGLGPGPFSYFFTVEGEDGSRHESAVFSGDTRRNEQGCVAIQKADSSPADTTQPKAGTPTASARRPRPPTPSQPPPRPADSSVGRSSKRTWLLLGAAGLATGGAAAVVTRSRSDAAADPGSDANASSSSDPAPLTGLWLGTQTITYPSACAEKSRIALRLTEDTGSLTGTLSYTVTSCDCCALGTGADAVLGWNDATSLRFRTPALLEYQGTRVRQRLEGGLQGQSGLTGSWSAERQP
jgi:hypothetical protein